MLPKDWSVVLSFSNQQASAASDVRAICPHCGNASTFAVTGQSFVASGQTTDIHLFLRCNYSGCRKTVYVYTASRFQTRGGNTPDMPFFMYPPRAIAPVHPSIPAAVADDWAEAQRAMQASAPKATAVMLRRVLYGVLLDRNCRLNPLKDGLQELIGKCRLPAIFDEWLPAIKDDGHDGAHPDRALQVSSENVNETMEYTEELLRFLYVEPYEFQQRKARNAASTSGKL